MASADRSDNGPGGTGASVTFTDLTQAQGETNPESLNGNTLQSNLIMPEPTHFLTDDNRKLPPVAIIRPTSTQNGGAVASFNSFVTDGLFIGQSNKEFFKVMNDLAEDADAARREL